MIVFLVLVIIAILLFGPKAVHNSAGKFLSGCFSLIVLALGLLLLDKVSRLINWHYFIPIVVLTVLMILIYFSFYKIRDVMNQDEKMNVTFSLVDAKPHTFVKVTDENGANVVLDPMEIYILIHKWNHAPYNTVWGTSFKKATDLELVNSNKTLKKKLKNKGSNFFLIQQHYVHSHQSNQTIILNHGAVMELQTWINTVKYTNDYVNKSYSL